MFGPVKGADPGAGNVRFEVYAEQYVLAIEVEAKVACRWHAPRIYPAVMTYLGDLAQFPESSGNLASPDKAFGLAKSRP